MRRLLFAFSAFALLAAASARGQLTIEIVGGAGTEVPIAIVPFENESNWPLGGITGIVGADLQRSGLFKLVNDSGITPRPYRAEDAKLGDFRARGADAVTVGSMRPLPDGRVDVRFALLDAVKQTQLASMSYVVAPAQFRATAHKIADIIYEKLTGDAGVFSTRIAYITKQGSRFELIVADADGANPQPVVTSNEPLLSPAWSPDGRRLVVTLSKDGGSQLYLINADGSGVTRLLTSPGIDTEASFTPDGSAILFSSDRGGTPQIYRLTLATRAVERMTFEGNWNVSPRALPDGRGFVFVRRDGGRFMIAIQDYATRQVQTLTPGPLDESPSIAPNSKLIIYAAQQGSRGTLAGVSSDGRVKQRLVSPAADVREPAWGPLPR